MGCFLKYEISKHTVSWPTKNWFYLAEILGCTIHLKKIPPIKARAVHILQRRAIRFIWNCMLFFWLWPIKSNFKCASPSNMVTVLLTQTNLNNINSIRKIAEVGIWSILTEIQSIHHPQTSILLTNDRKPPPKLSDIKRSGFSSVIEIITKQVSADRPSWRTPVRWRLRETHHVSRVFGGCFVYQTPIERSLKNIV